MIFYKQAGILAILVMMGGGLLSGCAGSGFLAPVEEARRDPPTSYTVVRGDTLYGIAWRYGLDYRQVAVWNRLANPDLIYPGQRIRLRSPGHETGIQAKSPIARRDHRSEESPKTSTISSASSIANSQNHSPKSRPETSNSMNPPRQLASASTRKRQPMSDPERRIEQLVWRWPVQGEIVRNYQPDVPGGKGIHIGGQLGQVIKAASPGQVVYSGNGLPGYGRLIIVKHADTLLSAYGYLGRILVKEGDNVEIGQPIAEMGTNSENHPALHFEIRQNGNPVNPLKFLPG